MTEETCAGCAAIRQRFPDYVDGAVSGRVMAAVAEHLEECASCRQDFAAWRAVGQALAVARPVQAPIDLQAMLRETIADETARRERWRLPQVSRRWAAFLQPILLRGAAGLVTAILLLGGIGWMVGEVAAPPVLANDIPLGALTAPHLLYSLARIQPVASAQETSVVVQAKVNQQGRVYDYRIVGGVADPATEARVRDQLMLLVYQPASAFGLPVRGEVLLSFSGVSVKG